MNTDSLHAHTHISFLPRLCSKYGEDIAICEIHSGKKLIYRNKQVCHWRVLWPTFKNKTPAMGLFSYCWHGTWHKIWNFGWLFPKGPQRGLLRGGFKSLFVKPNPSKVGTSVCVMWIQLCLHSQQVAQLQLIITRVPQGSQRS